MLNAPLKVDLSKVGHSDGLKFRYAEVWEDTPALAIVVLDAQGWAEVRLRMDLFKRVFIDHVNDSRIDRYADSRAGDVWEKIIEEARAPA